ncbi:hypothetical protein GTO27_02720 [Candidatus Bathyarchaeota archaeon]|nr:hypothetical protein [Candidatus Bathyarchaeota archaeon]
MEMEANMLDSHGFNTFIKRKLEKNGSGGRPHFIKELAKTYDPKDELLNMLEHLWINKQSISTIAHRYKTSYHTIYRLLQDIDHLKEEIITILMSTPRRKKFFNSDTESSDYETITTYIKRAKRDGLCNWKKVIKTAERCWKYFKHKNPKYWTADVVLDYLLTLSDGAQSSMLDAIRQIAPQIADKNSTEYIGTGRFREKVRRRKKDIFGDEILLIHEGLEALSLTLEKTVFDLHITLGAREGSKNPEAGLCGLSWARFKKDFTRVDVYESKVRGGIWCRSCPIDLFFKDLPQRLYGLWKIRKQPIQEKLILGGYKELRDIYKRIRQALKKYWKKKLDPSLYTELCTLKPHDADKIHCNLLWEAEVPLEVVAGQYLGQGEGIGLMGRIWLDINTIKKHYLSLTQRSERFKKLRQQVTEYSHKFNGTAQHQATSYPNKRARNLCLNWQEFQALQS